MLLVCYNQHKGDKKSVKAKLVKIAWPWSVLATILLLIMTVILTAKPAEAG